MWDQKHVHYNLYWNSFGFFSYFDSFIFIILCRKSSDVFFSLLFSRQVQTLLELKERSIRSIGSLSVKEIASFLQKLQAKLPTSIFRHFLWKIYLHWEHFSPFLSWLFFSLHVQQKQIPLVYFRCAYILW